LLSGTLFANLPQETIYLSGGIYAVQVLGAGAGGDGYRRITQRFRNQNI
jgi:hypothetical protein